MDPREDGRYEFDALAKVERLEAELRNKELLITLLEKQRADMERRIEEIHASNSWRLGAPFRAASAFVSAVMSGLRGVQPPRGRSAAARSGGAASEDPGTLPSEDAFVLYRIIGNDLPPRHSKGQSYENLRFILEHESDFPGCEKVFILNRIVDPRQESMVARLLDESGYRYFRIPFVAEEYRRIELVSDLIPQVEAHLQSTYVARDPGAASRLLMALHRHRINYVMSVNQARNVALDDGRSRARWILPWDGNCFLAADAWEEIRRDVARQPENRYFLVPMARMQSNAPLVSGGSVPQPVEEPQVIFRADAGEQFNPSIYYGHRDKVELLWRLGAGGTWLSYRDDPWDPPRPAVSSDAAHVGRTGWVARLYSGRSSLEEGTEHAASHRAIARSMGVMEMLRRLDDTIGVELSAECSLVLEHLKRK